MFTPLLMGAWTNRLCELHRFWVPGTQPQLEGWEGAALQPSGPVGCWGRRNSVYKPSAPGVSGLWRWIYALTADERSLALACWYAKSSFTAFFNGTSVVCTSGRLSQILLWGKEMSPTLLLSIWLCVSAISQGKICPFFCV